MSAWKFWQRALVGLVAILVFAAVVAAIGWATCITLIDSTEVGYSFNKWDGKVQVIDRPGYVFAWPFVNEVHTIDLQPMQLCLNANQRVLNCKLVQFDKKGLLTFVQWHGRKDYEVRAPGHDGKGSELMEILKAYAFEPGGTVYPFLTILNDTHAAGVVR